MASYLELHALLSDATLLQRMTLSVAVAADTIGKESGSTPYHAERCAWARRALQNPDGTARQLLLCVIAQNRTFTTAEIQAAGDASLQTAVDAAIPLLA